MICVTLALGISGCGVMERFRKAPVAAAPIATTADIATEIVAPVETTVLDSLGGGKTAAALDTTSAAEKAAALSAAPVASETSLGNVVVALGSPAEQGLWMRSALVTAPRKGRIVTASGATLAVDLLPGTGGAQLSLAGFQALGLSLTDLPEVSVFGL